MFILIVGSKIRHCLLQLGFENSILHLRSGLPYFLFLLLFLYMCFFFSINRFFYFIINLCLESLMFLYLVLMETGEKLKWLEKDFSISRVYNIEKF